MTIALLVFELAINWSSDYCLLIQVMCCLVFIILVRNYKNYEEISRALRDREVKGALVDLYVLSSYKHLFDDPRFRIVRVYDYKASYGVVLAGHSMELQKCFTEYTKAHAESVFRRIEENIKILKVR